MAVSSFNTESDIKALNAFLETRSYIEGQVQVEHDELLHMEASHESTKQKREREKHACLLFVPVLMSFSLLLVLAHL